MSRRVRPVRVSVERIAMSDGVLLEADVAVPDDGKQYPALVHRSPYGRDGMWAAYGPVYRSRQGWGVVTQDARGRFGSGGEFDPFIQEGPDGADTVAWCRKQPWCDGRVVMAGHSYIAIASWLAALQRPKGLKSIVTQIGSSDPGTFLREGGAFRQRLIQMWGVQTVSQDPPSAEVRRRAEDLTQRLGREQLVLADPEILDLFPPFRRWLQQDGAEWTRVAAARARKLPDISTFGVAGWFDPFCDAALGDFTAMAATNGKPQRLIVGPWSHNGQYPSSVSALDFGPRGTGQAGKVAKELEAWFKGSLEDSTALPSGVRLFLMGTNRWLEFGSWPPPASELRLHLDAGGSLSRAVPSRPGSESFRYDPHAPVPTRGGRDLIPAPGPVEQSDIEQRADVLVYTSEPLERDLSIVGKVAASIWFASSGRSADVTVRLVDVHPEGRPIGMLDSVRRQMFTPGRTKRVQVEVGTIAHTFRTGHRVRVQVSSSNFPRLDRNPSTGQDPLDVTALLPADQTVRRGGRAASYVSLPILDA